MVEGFTYMAANNANVWEYRTRGWPLGWIMSPEGMRSPMRGSREMPYALDNGLFRPPDEEPATYEDRLLIYTSVIRALTSKWHDPMFVVVPDVPYHGEKSLMISREHLQTMRRLFGSQLPLAIAVQDGMEVDEDTVDGFDWVFVGGSTDFKLKTGRRWAEIAKELGMGLHIARVNTADRVRWAIDIGADSADGTGIFRGDQQQLKGVFEALCEDTLW